MHRIWILLAALTFVFAVEAGASEPVLLERGQFATTWTPAPPVTAVQGTKRPDWRRYRFRVEVEAGPVWQTKNDARVPGTTGTDVDFLDLIGNGPFPYGRITFDWRISRKHGLRALVAPLEISGTGVLPQTTSFNNVVFDPGVPTKATYRFNSYRLTYRYFLVDRSKWTVTVGVTVKIRDALTRLEQAGKCSTKSDLGVVPLLHADAAWRFAPRWTLYGNFDGWAVSQGRAFDLALKLYYDLSDRWSVGLGYRTIEGGADVDSVYTFAWFHQALVTVAFRF